MFQSDFSLIYHAGGFDDNGNDDGFGEEASFDDDAGQDMDISALAQAAAEGGFPAGMGAWQSTDQVRNHFLQPPHRFVMLMYHTIPSIAVLGDL